MEAGDVFALITVMSVLFLGLPWMILHYVTQWRKSKGITVEDEQLLDDLYEMSRRLDGRLDSIERIIAADNPGWKDGAIATVTRLEPQLRDRR